MFGPTKTLIVVYKDEMLVNQLKKLVETNDDTDEENPVGTTDGSISIVSWAEKVWLANKKAGNIKDKVLFLGDIKGTESLVPVIDVRFDEYGVKYGWAGDQALIFADVKALGNRDTYREFIGKLAQLPIPEMVKKPLNLREEEEAQKSKLEAKEAATDLKPDDKTPLFLKKAREMMESGAEVVGKAGLVVADTAGDLFRDRNALKRQMLFYGLVHLYRDGLEDFVNM